MAFTLLCSLKELMDKSAKKSKRSKRRRWLWGTLLFILLLLGTGVLFLQSSAGKRWLTQQVANLANRYVFHHAEIELVEWSFPFRLELTNLVIYDHKDSVLASANTVRVDPDWRTFRDSNIVLDEVILSNFELNLHKYVGDTSFNYRYALKSSNAAKAEVGKTFSITNAILDNGAFSFHQFHREKDPSAKQIDFNHMEIDGIRGKARNLMVQDVITFSVTDLSCREKSGFALSQFSTNAIIADSLIAFNQTQGTTALGSQLSVDYAMHISDPSDLDDFENLVMQKATVRSSHIMLEDLQYFSSGIDFLSNDVTVSGEYHGMVNAFFVNDLNLTFDETHYAKADLRISNVTIPEQMFIDLKVRESLTEANTIRRYYPSADLPKALDALGNVSANGQFTGVLNDFVAYASFNTELGKVNSDIRLELGDRDIDNRYSGSLGLEKFDLGKLTGESIIGKASLKADIDGFGFTVDSVENNIDGSISSIEINKYTYKNIKVDGKTKNRFFKGDLVLNDTNARLRFDGKIDFSTSVPEYQFVADIKKTDLKALHITKEPVVFKGLLTTNFKASSLEDLVGSFNAENATLLFQEKTYNIQQAQLRATLHDTVKVWRLRSDFADGSLATTGLLADIPGALQHAASSMLQHRKFHYHKPTRDAYISYKFNLKNTEPLVQIIGEDLFISPNTRLEGYVHERQDTFFIKASGELAHWNDLDLHFWSLQLSQTEEVTGYANIGELAFAQDTFVSSYRLDVSGDDSTLFTAHAANIAQNVAKVQLNAELGLQADDSNSLVIDSSMVALAGGTFSLKSGSIQWVGADEFSIDSFLVFTDQEKMQVDGKVFTSGKYNLVAQLQQIQVSNFRPYLSSFFADLAGNINGTFHAQNPNGYTVVESDLHVDSLALQGLDLHSAYINSKYLSERRLLVLYSTVSRADSNEFFTAKGGINYAEKDPTMDLRLGLNRVPISMFDTLLVDIMSQTQGHASGQMRLSGAVNDPDVYGYAFFDSTAFLVDYLQTRYRMHDTFRINKRNIILDRVQLLDEKDDEAYLHGKIAHNQFSTFNLDLELDARNFQMLNTTAVDNDLFYGTANCTGKSHFSGPLLSVLMDLNLKTEKGTKLHLPIEEETGYTRQTFINFVNTPDDSQIVKVENEDQFALDLNLRVSDEAEVQLIFDKQLGDIIKASGNGILSMKLSPGGDFEMYGDYIIKEGNYLFTAFDLINKRFKVKEGSKVSWVGDPYDAEIDILAYYELKANAGLLVSAMDNVNTENLKNAVVPVEARASLKGSLLQPEIKLSYELIDNGIADVGVIKRELAAMNLSQEEIDKQVVSLLVLNRFMPIYTGVSTTTGGAFSTGYEASLGDLVSNQVTNWLSTIDEDLSVNLNYNGIDYVGSDNVVMTESELELALSYSFFNDKVQVNYAYEFRNNYRPNTEISYRLDEDGDVKVKLFNRQSQNPIVSQDTKTYGLGLFFRREFDSLKELFKKDKKKDKTK